MPDIHEKAKTVFGRALAMNSADEQAKYLNEACDGNTSLRVEVEE